MNLLTLHVIVRTRSDHVTALQFCFCPEGVGVRLADDGLRSGPDPSTGYDASTRFAAASSQIASTLRACGSAQTHRSRNASVLAFNTGFNR